MSSNDWINLTDIIILQGLQLPLTSISDYMTGLQSFEDEISDLLINLLNNIV